MLPDPLGPWNGKGRGLGSPSGAWVSAQSASLAFGHWDFRVPPFLFSLLLLHFPGSAGAAFPSSPCAAQRRAHGRHPAWPP